MRPGRGPAAVAAVASATLLAGACDRSPAPITEESLRNATYRTETTESGTVTLEGGAYHATGTPGTPGELAIRFVDHAVGDLDGDGRDDAAVVLVEEAGDERLFRLHARLSDEDGGTRDVASRLLGDRIRIRGVRILDDLIATDLLIRAPGEPVAAPPSVPTTLGFALTGRGLLPIDPPGAGVERRGLSPGDPLARLSSGDWLLSGLGAEGGAELLADVSRLPRLRFTPELLDEDGVRGRLSGFAGCNRIFASYRADAEGGLRVSAPARTRRSCEGPEAELERLITDALETAGRFSLEGDDLVLHGSAGDLRFAPAAGPPEDPLAPAPAARVGAAPTPVDATRNREAGS